MGTYQSQATEIEENSEAEDFKLSLESDLQRFLRCNITQIEPGLKIIDGGTERTVESGRVDILAEDNQGFTVVIELKAKTADRGAIGQILAYMGDLGAANPKVRGILIAYDFAPPARSAARLVPSLRLLRYTTKFPLPRSNRRSEGQCCGQPLEPSIPSQSRPVSTPAASGLYPTSSRSQKGQEMDPRLIVRIGIVCLADHSVVPAADQFRCDKHRRPRVGKIAIRQRLISQYGLLSYPWPLTTTLASRRPRLPFSREAAALASLRVRPPAAPSCAAIQRFEPSTPSNKAGT
jgi:hypothetical protein